MKIPFWRVENDALYLALLFGASLVGGFSGAALALWLVS